MLSDLIDLSSMLAKKSYPHLFSDVQTKLKTSPLWQSCEQMTKRSGFVSPLKRKHLCRQKVPLIVCRVVINFKPLLIETSTWLLTAKAHVRRTQILTFPKDFLSKVANCPCLSGQFTLVSRFDRGRCWLCTSEVQLLRKTDSTCWETELRRNGSFFELKKMKMLQIFSLRWCH